MYTGVLLSTLTATALAAPLVQKQAPNPTTGESNTWLPASGTKATCDTESDHLISFMQGVMLSTALDNACATMMPACAYADRVHVDFCKATVDYALDSPKSSVQDVNVVDENGNKQSGWNAKFEVTPAPQPEGSPGVFWKVSDCYGYFAYMLQNSTSEGGCHNGNTSMIGNVNVGGNSALKDTVFKVTIIRGETQ